MLTYTDEVGQVVDTGVATRPTVRPTAETPLILPNQVDTGTRTSPVQRPPRRPNGQSR